MSVSLNISSGIEITLFWHQYRPAGVVEPFCHLYGEWSEKFETQTYVVMCRSSNMPPCFSIIFVSMNINTWVLYIYVSIWYRYVLSFLECIISGQMVQRWLFSRYFLCWPEVNSSKEKTLPVSWNDARAWIVTKTAANEYFHFQWFLHIFFGTNPYIFGFTFEAPPTSQNIQKHPWLILSSKSTRIHVC